MFVVEEQNGEKYWNTSESFVTKSTGKRTTKGISYFKNKDSKTTLFINDLLDTYTACVNNIVLTELIPVLSSQKEYKLIDLLSSLTNIPLSINWQDLIEIQSKNIQSGINKVGIPDLIILQNVIQNDLQLFSLDKHFRLMRNITGFNLIDLGFVKK